MKIRPLLSAAIGIALTLPAHAQKVQERPREPAPAVALLADQVGPEPIGSPYDWLSNADYPIESWRNREEGDVSYALSVDTTGGVTDCTAEGSASPALKAETCRLLRERARFEPATDRNGKAVSATYSGFHLWQRREPEFGNGSFTLKVAFTLDERGNVSNCRVIERAGQVSEDLERSFERKPCPVGRRGNPARDAEGRPVARDVVLTVSVESTPAATAPTPAPQGN